MRAVKWLRRKPAPAVLNGNDYYWMACRAPVRIEEIQGVVDRSLGAASVREAWELQARWHFCKWCGRDQR